VNVVTVFDAFITGFLPEDEPYQFVIVIGFPLEPESVKYIPPSYLIESRIAIVTPVLKEVLFDILLNVFQDVFFVKPSLLSSLQDHLYNKFEQKFLTQHTKRQRIR